MQGLYELNMDEDMSDALTENIDTLMIIPSKVFCPEARYFFIEKGAIKFKEDIENLLSAYKNRDIFQIALGTLSEAILKNEDIR